MENEAAQELYLFYRRRYTSLTIPSFFLIWEKILLNNLDSLVGLRNAVNSSKEWRRILHPYRTLWLFPKVFPLLKNYLGKDDKPACRLVCQVWSQGIDDCDGVAGVLNPAPYDSSREQKLARRQNLWEQWPGFPYLRKLVITFWDPLISNLHWANLIELKLSLYDDFELKSLRLIAPRLQNLHISRPWVSEADSINDMYGQQGKNPKNMLVSRRYYEELFKMLTDCPNLISLSLFDGSCKCQWDCWCQLPWTGLPRRLQRLSFPHLTNMTLNHRRVSLKFLQLFPNLKYLSFPLPETVHKTAWDEVDYPEDYCWKLNDDAKFLLQYTSRWSPRGDGIIDKRCPFCGKWDWWWVESKLALEHDSHSSNSNWFSMASVQETLGLFSLPSLQQLSLGETTYQRVDKIWEEVWPRQEKKNNRIRILHLKGKKANAVEVLSTPGRWYWDSFDYGYSLQLLRLIPFQHTLHLEANSPNFATADFWMKRLSSFQELFPTVKSISFSHSPVSKDFLLCFPNVECLQLPSYTDGVGHYFCKRWEDPILYDIYNQTSDVIKKEELHPMKSVEESEVWDLFPRLQKIVLIKINVETQSKEIKVTYNRPSQM